ncbi:MAG: type IV-A pilus assembly ATPase PilB [Zoogloeaceae bacterium]|jgi:type IV pilus assembly protein PilB|nr:type IV-A pilus assembly ATPase PilB [Zoogloeaceae bacterium]
MAESAAPSSLGGLALTLVRSNLLKESDAARLLAQSSASKTSFAETLVSAQIISASELAKLASDTFSVPLFDLDAYDETQAPQSIDKTLAQQHAIIPLCQRGNRLIIATADPADRRGLDAIRFQSGMALDTVVVEVDKLVGLVDKLSEDAKSMLSRSDTGGLEGDDLDSALANEELEERSDVVSLDADVEDAPIVRFLQKILLDAINEGASDIHFEPYEKFYRIRFRVDGALKEVTNPPLAIREKLASRIKVISRLDISEKRLPQDGRTKLAVTKTRIIDFRVSTLPTLYGEKIVMRILDSSTTTMGIEILGYSEEQKNTLLDAIRRPYGMVLTTGPTGSGKTVSLYSCLNILNSPGTNISTVEDPAEINLPGVNQVNVDEKTGLTFASALRSFLRQDPDVIMVGEIRDLETAEIAVRAAQTGHMVLSSLHTNDAAQTIVRLVDMGIPVFNIASSILLISAQRLVRRLCPDCKEPAEMPRAALLSAGFTEKDLAEKWTLYKPKGCMKCKGKGYKGRIGIYQVMPISDAIRHLILSHATVMEIAKQSSADGVKTLREAGILKIKQGMTSLEEVLSSTNI